MLRTTKNMKEKYEKIQSSLFSLIPEKWEAIYLYASVLPKSKNGQTGELFFYYLPKGILKKKPINVYEVPSRFNINEEQYLKFVSDLYDIIKDLKQDFVNTEQDLWTNITITISNLKFKIEYRYDKIHFNEKENNERLVIWRYKYLNLGGEKKEERKILDKFFSEKRKDRKETYETGVYLKTENNTVIFDKEDSKFQKEVVLYEKDKKIEEDEQNDEIEEIEELEKDEDIKKKKNGKNQILNM